jgi:hypothetical protein
MDFFPILTTSLSNYGKILKQQKFTKTHQVTNFHKSVDCVKRGHKEWL